jgi:hypothetical protein
VKKITYALVTTSTLSAQANLTVLALMWSGLSWDKGQDDQGDQHDQGFAMVKKCFFGFNHR